MTTEEKIIKNKVGLLRLAETLGNISQACRVMGYSRESCNQCSENVCEPCWVCTAPTPDGYCNDVKWRTCEARDTYVLRHVNSTGWSCSPDLLSCCLVDVYESRQIYDLCSQEEVSSTCNHLGWERIYDPGICAMLAASPSSGCDGEVFPWF